MNIIALLLLRCHNVKIGKEASEVTAGKPHFQEFEVILWKGKETVWEEGADFLWNM